MQIRVFQTVPWLVFGIAFVISTASAPAISPVFDLNKEPRVYEEILAFMNSPDSEASQAPDWQTEWNRLASERRQTLQTLADEIDASLRKTGTAQLTFICTHNSRRSHLAQVWMRVAATHFGFAEDEIRCFSGGTEATACNPRTVASLQRVGFDVTSDSETSPSDNPKYTIRYSDTAATLVCFSKIYDRAPNPTGKFIAVMCCGSAAEKCPVVAGADARVPVLYEDPKIADDTAEEAEMYDARSRQIALEMGCVMSRVAELSDRSR